LFKKPNGDPQLTGWTGYDCSVRIKMTAFFVPDKIQTLTITSFPRPQSVSKLKGLDSM
jgi:hypothetical protein